MEALLPLGARPSDIFKIPTVVTISTSVVLVVILNILIHSHFHIFIFVFLLVFVYVVVHDEFLEEIVSCASEWDESIAFVSVA